MMVTREAFEAIQRENENLKIQLRMCQTERPEMSQDAAIKQLDIADPPQADAMHAIWKPILDDVERWRQEQEQFMIGTVTRLRTKIHAQRRELRRLNRLTEALRGR